MTGLLGESLLGYPLRSPYPSERDFFSFNPEVAGMAAEDSAITLNPFSPLTEAQRAAVAQNEALRLWLRQRGVSPRFDLSEQQAKYFAGTPYGEQGNEQAARDSILARLASGDASAGAATQQQQQWLDWIVRQLGSEGLLR